MSENAVTIPIHDLAILLHFDIERKLVLGPSGGCEYTLVGPQLTFPMRVCTPGAPHGPPRVLKTCWPGFQNR